MDDGARTPTLRFIIPQKLLHSILDAFRLDFHLFVRGLICVYFGALPSPDSMSPFGIDVSPIHVDFKFCLTCIQLELLSFGQSPPRRFRLAGVSRRWVAVSGRLAFKTVVRVLAVSIPQSSLRVCWPRPCAVVLLADAFLHFWCLCRSSEFSSGRQK
jgi:hypothetical protein